MTTITHEMAIPQSIGSMGDLRMVCGLPSSTLRPHDRVHSIAADDEPEAVTCVGCLAVRELADARVALGEAWLRNGVSLAAGIERKTWRLESMPGGPAVALIEAVLSAHRDDIPPRIRELAEQARGPELTPALASHIETWTADPMRPTVAVPRDLVEAIVDDVRQGLAVESETADELAALLGGGA